MSAMLKPEICREYMAGRFDRHAFDPFNRPDHGFTLMRLRTPGRIRSWHYQTGAIWPHWPYGQKHEKNHFWCCGSSALKALYNESFLDLKARGVTDEVYIDIGCGESPDTLIARSVGYKAFAVDLFAPLPSSMLERRFIHADALALPFDDWSADYITSQAVIDLVPPDDRMSFYREACRVLKIGGVFSMTGAVLRCGYGYKQGIENQRARDLPFWEVQPTINGFRALRVG